MKRSTLELDLNNWLDHAEEITGKTILDYVESKGMQPPGVHYLPTSVPGDWIKSSGGYGSVYLHKWEPEDEKK